MDQDRPNRNKNKRYKVSPKHQSNCLAIKAAVAYSQDMQCKLLSIEADAKTTKGSDFGVLTGILYLSPANEASEAVNLCPMASEECRRAGSVAKIH
jgi:hypothetical protein